jgi:RNA 2',3'-cyclic 3'-phosphodiesterase
MRAFLAAEIPYDIKEYLLAIIKTMSIRIEGVKWVREEGQHITLKFFGEIEEDLAAGIKRALLHLGEAYEPVATTLKRIDAFPNMKRARVIVVGLGKGVDNIQRIFNDIENNLAPLGIEKEQRSFTPHITLGRRKSSMPVLERDLPTVEEKPFIVRKLVLFKSTLTPQGAIYDPVWEIRLEKQ